MRTFATGSRVRIKKTLGRNPVRFRVMKAPLWGKVSMPPLAIEATRCRTSSGMPAALAAAMN